MSLFTLWAVFVLGLVLQLGAMAVVVDWVGQNGLLPSVAIMIGSAMVTWAVTHK